MKLRFRTMDGALLESDFEASDFVYNMSQQLAAVHKPDQQVSARLVHQGTVLSPGFRVSECSLKEDDLIDVVWFTWIEPPKEGNSGSEVLPRRSKESFQMADGHLDACGIFVRDMMERQSFAADLASQVTATLRILDVRQCGLRCESVRAIFEQLPESLEELWASRNHIDSQAMKSLGERSLKNLRVLDVGYSECEDLEALPDLVNENMEQLILGDLCDLDVDCLEQTLAKCPELRFLDIQTNDKLAAAGAIARSSKLQKLFARRVDLEAEALTQILLGCLCLQHLAIDGVSESHAELLAKLNLKVLVIGVTDKAILPKICALKVETLLIEPQMMDDEDIPLYFFEDVGPTVEALKSSTATSISLHTNAFDVGVLEAIGPRLYAVGPRMDHGTHSILSSLRKVPLCCANLISLTVNYWEQIDGKELALVAAACPMLQEVSLNADDFDFQATPIDEGVLALGKHCHQLEHLDMYDRLMEEPVETILGASEGWPLLRYLCIAGCARPSWEKVSGAERLVPALAKCPKLQQVVVYDDWTSKKLDELERLCPLYGAELLNYDTDDCCEE